MFTPEVAVDLIIEALHVVMLLVVILVVPGLLMGLLVALVQAQALASIVPGPGVLAFAAVVVLSMLATMAFDPRLIWDSAEQGENA